MLPILKNFYKERVGGIGNAKAQRLEVVEGLRIFNV